MLLKRDLMEAIRKIEPEFQFELKVRKKRGIEVGCYGHVHNPQIEKSIFISTDSTNPVKCKMRIPVYNSDYTLSCENIEMLNVYLDEKTIVNSIIDDLKADRRLQLKRSEWDSISADYKGCWTRETWNVRNGAFPESWIGRKTLLYEGGNLLTEGIGFVIIE